MNYKKLYHSIIDNRLNDIPEGYKENHHIIPRSIGGTDDSENLVNLTAKEHYVAHHLLFKMYPDNPYIERGHRMMYIGTRKDGLKFSAKEFERLSVEHSNFLKSNRNPSNLPVMINGDFYFSKMEACRILKIHPNTLHSRLISKSRRFKDWMFVNKETGEQIKKRTTKSSYSPYYIIKGIKYKTQREAEEKTGESKKSIYRKLNLDIFPEYMYAEEYYED